MIFALLPEREWIKGISGSPWFKEGEGVEILS